MLKTKGNYSTGIKMSKKLQVIVKFIFHFIYVNFTMHTDCWLVWMHTGFGEKRIVFGNYVLWPKAFGYNFFLLKTGAQILKIFGISLPSQLYNFIISIYK